MAMTMKVAIRGLCVFFHTSMNHQREWNLTEILLSERLSKCAQLHLFTQCEQNRHVWNFTGRTSTP